MTPEEYWQKWVQAYYGPNRQEVIACKFAQAYADHILAAYRATQNEPGGKLTARQWLCTGGGGFEDGEDGIRACVPSMEWTIELMDEFAEYRASVGEPGKDENAE